MTSATANPPAFLCPFHEAPLKIPEGHSCICQTFVDLASRFANRRALGNREFLLAAKAPRADAAERETVLASDVQRGDYEWYSFSDVLALASCLAAGMREAGIGPGTRAAISSVNRPEWNIVDISLNALGAISVPIYESQTPEEIEFVCRDAGVDTIIAAPDRLPKLAGALSKLPEISRVILFDDRADDRSFLIRNQARLSSAGSPVAPGAQQDEGVVPMSLRLPAVTPFRMRPFEVFDAADAVEGIADPRPLTPEEKASPEGTRSRYSRIVTGDPVSTGEGDASGQGVTGFADQKQSFQKDTSTQLSESTAKPCGASPKTPLQLYTYSPNHLLPHELDSLPDEDITQLLGRVTHTFCGLYMQGIEAACAKRDTATTSQGNQDAPASASAQSSARAWREAQFRSPADILSAIEACVADFKELAAKRAPSDIYSFVYTNGTTGRPKGVVILNSNFAWTTHSICRRAFLTPVHPLGITKPYQEFLISFLPNAHIFQRMIHWAGWLTGAAIGYWQGSMRTLMDDVCACRPTFFLVVPRVLQRIFDGLMAKVNSLGTMERFLFLSAIGSRKKAMQDGEPYPKWTKKVLDKNRAMIGGRAIKVVSGSAPLSAKVGEFLKLCWGCLLFEGYGMTETTAQGLVQQPETDHWGTMGDCIDSETRIKLVSVPEMDYYATDTPNPRGEVYITSPSIFLEYHNDPDRTAEAFEFEDEQITEPDGTVRTQRTRWFRTGDIGQYLSDYGEIQLIDRKRCIQKLSQGEYVSNSAVEGAMLRSLLVDQAYMYANRYQSYTLAVIVPSFPALRKEMEATSPGSTSEGGRPMTDVQLCSHAVAIRVVLRGILEACHEASLRSFEIPKGVILESSPWTPDNGMLTPAQKLKHFAVRKRYEVALEDLFSRLAEKQAEAGGDKKMDPEDYVAVCAAAAREGPRETELHSEVETSAISGITRTSVESKD